MTGIALGVTVAQGAAAQRQPGNPAAGTCTLSPGPHDQCPERCPTYDTCYVEDEQALYYRVDAGRFDCDGLDCGQARAALTDFCCQRGEFAPRRSSGGGGGGCGLAGAPVWTGRRGAGAAGPAAGVAALIAALAFRSRGWRRRSK